MEHVHLFNLFAIMKKSQFFWERFDVKLYLVKDWLRDDCQMLLGEIIVCNIIPSFMIAKKS
jgi:hypothetical protein